MTWYKYNASVVKINNNNDGMLSSPSPSLHHHHIVHHIKFLHLLITNFDSLYEPFIDLNMWLQLYLLAEVISLFESMHDQGHKKLLLKDTVFA